MYTNQKKMLGWVATRANVERYVFSVADPLAPPPPPVGGVITVGSLLIIDRGEIDMTIFPLPRGS